MQMSGRLQPGPALIACVSPRARTHICAFSFARPIYSLFYFRILS